MVSAISSAGMAPDSSHEPYALSAQIGIRRPVGSGGPADRHMRQRLGQVGQAIPTSQDVEVGARSALDGELGTTPNLYRSLLPADRSPVITELPIPLG